MPWPHDLHHCTIGSLATPSSSSPFAFPASQGGLLAQPPLAIPRGTRLRGPSGSLRCSIYRGSVKLVATLLRHPTLLFPDKSALLARVNGTNTECTLHCPSIHPVQNELTENTFFQKLTQRVALSLLPQRQLLSLRRCAGQ